MGAGIRQRIGRFFMQNKVRYLFIGIIALVAFRTFASEPNRRIPSPIDRSSTLKSQTQGEQMLKSLNSPKPDFMRSPASITSRISGVCANNHGAVHNSRDNRRGYEECLSNERAVNPAGQAGAGAAIMIYP